MRSTPAAEPLCLLEEFRAVPGYGLSVSAAGVIRGPRGIRKVHPGAGPASSYLYVTVRIPGRTFPGKLRVHVAVLLAWVGPCPPGMEARHLNGDSWDNRLENLTWASHVDNCADKARHGTLVRGEAAPTAKLTEADVREMRRLWPTTSAAALARRYGVGPKTAWKVVAGRTWRHVT